MNKVFILQHSYEICHEGVSIDRTKFIGAYSTKEKAEEVVQRYKNIEGFRDYPITCFYIDEYLLDKDNWSEGFVCVDDIEEDFRTLTICLNKFCNIEKTAEESWENNNYYQAVCEVGEKIYKAKDTVELAAHISSVWSIRFKDNPKTTDECLNVATKILDSLILR